MKINNLTTPPQLIKGRRRYLLKKEDALPLGYTKLEYLESNGNQYIDTGFSSALGFRAEMIISINSDSEESYLIGSHNESAPYCRNGLSIVNNGLRMEMCGYEDVATIYSNIVYKIDVSTIIPNAFLKIDDNIIKKWESYISPDTSSNGTQLSSNNVLIFASQWNLSVIETKKILSSKLYSCKIYDSNGILVRDYIPCTNESGKKGLYDTVNGAFEGLRGSQICIISEYNAYSEDLLGIQTDKPVTSDITISYVLHSGSYDTTGTVSWGEGNLTSVRITSGNQIKTWQVWNSYSDISGIISVYPKYDDTYTYMISNPKIVNNISIVNKSDGKYIRFQYVPRSGDWVKYFTDFLVEIGQTEIPYITTDGINRDFRITAVDDAAWIIDAISCDMDYAFTWNNNEIK